VFGVLQIRHSLTQALYQNCNKYLRGKNDLIPLLVAMDRMKCKVYIFIGAIKRILTLLLAIQFDKVEREAKSLRYILYLMLLRLFNIKIIYKLFRGTFNNSVVISL
jgi:hypothetical protein